MAVWVQSCDGRILILYVSYQLVMLRGTGRDLPMLRFGTRSRRVNLERGWGYKRPSRLEF